jgi:hypothetical protein
MGRRNTIVTLIEYCDPNFSLNNLQNNKPMKKQQEHDFCRCFEMSELTRLLSMKHQKYYHPIKSCQYNRRSS